jgi:hypothetical protein
VYDFGLGTSTDHKFRVTITCPSYVDTFFSAEASYFELSPAGQIILINDYTSTYNVNQLKQNGTPIFSGSLWYGSQVPVNIPNITSPFNYGLKVAGGGVLMAVSVFEVKRLGVVVYTHTFSDKEFNVPATWILEAGDQLIVRDE